MGQPAPRLMQGNTTMSSASVEDELRARIAELEAENARLRQVEAAAREVLALYEGRRPGFASSYARDVLRQAFAGDEVALGRPYRRKSSRSGQRKATRQK